MTTSDFIILALPTVLLVGTFYSAGELIRRRMRAPNVPRFLDDLRGLEDAFVDFFASSRTSSGILRVLGEHKKPIGFKALAEKVRGREGNRAHNDEMPLAALRAVLKILLFARLARMGARGFSVTELGREVYRRMSRSGRESTLRVSGAPAERERLDRTDLDGARSSSHLSYAGTGPATIA